MTSNSFPDGRLGRLGNPTWSEVYSRKYPAQLEGHPAGIGPSVQGLLDFLPPGAIRSVVVFTGHAEFKTGIPQGVTTISQLVEYLRDQREEVMSLNRVQFCVGRLETARLAIRGETDVEHIRSLERRRGGAR